jgi:hypothetical protein
LALRVLQRVREALILSTKFLRRFDFVFRVHGASGAGHVMFLFIIAPHVPQRRRQG